MLGHSATMLSRGGAYSLAGDGFLAAACGRPAEPVPWLGFALQRLRILPTVTRSRWWHCRTEISVETPMTTCTVPTDLPTLAWAVPGQQLEIRHILRGAGVSCRRLRHGDLVVCRQINRGGILLDLQRGGCISIPYECAQYIQVERVGPTTFPLFWRDSIALPARHLGPGAAAPRIADRTAAKARVRKTQQERIKP
jgi:hypothetical protein